MIEKSLCFTADFHGAMRVLKAFCFYRYKLQPHFDNPYGKYLMFEGSVVKIP